MTTYADRLGDWDGHTRRPGRGQAADLHHPTTSIGPVPDDTVERALANLARVPAATPDDINLIRRMLTDPIPYTASGSHGPGGCARQITTRDGVQDCPCSRHVPRSRPGRRKPRGWRNSR